MKNCFWPLSIATLLVVSCSSPLLFAAAAGHDANPAQVTFEQFKSPEGRFSVSVPSGWDRIDSYPYKIDDTIHGVMLEGQENAEGAPMTIAVLHYAGTGSIKGVDHYIKKVLSSPMRLDADQEAKFSDVIFAGRKGTEFTFKKLHLVMLPFSPPPMEDGVIYEINPPTRKVTMVVRHIVIPADPGFYALWFETPEDKSDEFSGVFDNVVKSFAIQETHGEYVSSGNYFKCMIPEGWSVRPPAALGLSEDEKKVYGVQFSGPHGEGPVKPEISVHYYAPGNLLEKTMDAFIKRRSGPLVHEGKSYGEVRPHEFAGRKAETFETISFRNPGGRQINPEMVSVYQKFIVISAMKDDGFYVLQLSAPVAAKDQYAKAFEEVSKSFLPAK